MISPHGEPGAVLTLIEEERINQTVARWKAKDWTASVLDWFPAPLSSEEVSEMEEAYYRLLMVSPEALAKAHAEWHNS